MYKLSLAVLALTTVSGVSLDKHRHHHHKNQALQQLKEDYNLLESKYEHLEQLVMTNNNAQKGNKFAEGMNEEEKLGEQIRMKGDAGLDTYKYVQIEDPAELTIPAKYIADTPYGSKTQIVDIPYKPTPENAPTMSSSQGVLTSPPNSKLSDSVPGGYKNFLLPSAKGPVLENDAQFAPTFQSQPQAMLRGNEGKSEIVESNALNAWLDNQETRAQVRPPYRSAVQIADEIQAPEDSELVSVTSDEDIETLEARDVPINFRFVHIATEDGELMRSI